MKLIKIYEILIYYLKRNVFQQISRIRIIYIVSFKYYLFVIDFIILSFGRINLNFGRINLNFGRIILSILLSFSKRIQLFINGGFFFKIDGFTNPCYGIYKLYYYYIQINGGFFFKTDELTNPCYGIYKLHYFYYIQINGGFSLKPMN